MKKILSNIYLLAALFVLGAAITSCSKSDDTPTPEPKPVGPTTYTMTIKATKSADAKTRALSLDGSTLNATWTVGDQVTVYNKTKEASLEGYLEAKTAGESTTLRGTLTGTIEDGDKLTLKFLSPSYSSQNGTLEYIAAHCDYATASVSVTDASTPSVTTTDASFINEQAIVKFKLMDVDKAQDANISASSLKIFAKGLKTSGNTTGAITITPESPANEIYAALSGINDATVKLTATVGTKTYTYYRDNVTFTNGQYYSVNVKMFDPYSTPLTIEAYNGPAVVSFNLINQNDQPLYYSKDGNSWTPYNTRNINLDISLSQGQKLYIKGDDITNGDSEGPTRISCSGACYVYGNMMSLIYFDFINKNEITRPYVFMNLFQMLDQNNFPTDNPYIKNHSTKELVLPATKLGTPEQPAISCYQSMFWGCYNLERAPELPALHVPDDAYQSMFAECSNLNYVKCLATSFGTNSTNEWFWCTENTPTTGTFVVNSSLYIDPEHPTTYPVKESQNGGTVWERNYSGILSGWTVIEE